jgi:hypothetical protein
LLTSKVRILVDHVLNKGCQNHNFDKILPVHLVGVDKDFLWEKRRLQQERFQRELVELVVDVMTLV